MVIDAELVGVGVQEGVTGVSGDSKAAFLMAFSQQQALIGFSGVRLSLV